jgi:hypothetical protein
MNSPTAIDSAPGSSPDSPVSSTVRLPAPPITPSTSATLPTSPSLAPKTAARRVLDIRARPRAASPRTTSPCIRSSASIATGTSASGTGQPALGLFRQCQHEHPTEPPREDDQ